MRERPASTPGPRLWALESAAPDLRVLAPVLSRTLLHGIRKCLETSFSKTMLFLVHGSKGAVVCA